MRPYREVYVHVGHRPKNLRDLTEDEKARYKDLGYVKYEAYGPERLPSLGRFWTEEDLKARCGAETRMPAHCARQYAVDPKAYGQTFCCRCGGYYPVDEFVWAGTDERVGS